jgi:hypothetical protein
MKVLVFWDMTPCRLVYRYCTNVCCCWTLLKMEGGSTSETLVRIHQSTGLHIPEGWDHLQHRCENLDSYLFVLSAAKDEENTYIDKLVC